ncbi:uncharacterized protein [Bemisia tabaci]
MVVTCKMVGTRFMVQWEEHPSHLSTRLGRLLEAQAFVDVTLMCATHSLRVHGSVLAACSPYFEDLLKLQVGHHPLIMLKDMKFCVLRALIEFMYCGETSITEADLRPLLDAAKFFKVKGLSSMTAEVLSDLPQSKVSQASVSEEGKNVTCCKTPHTSTASTLSTSGANFIKSSKKTSIVRPRKSIAPPKIDSVAVEMNDSSGLPQDESAQILLSLSGNNKVVQRGSRGRGSNNRLLTQGPGRPPNKPIVISNCSFGSADSQIETRSKLVNTFEPRKRGRKKQQIASVSSSSRELLDGSNQSVSSLKSFESSNSIIDNFKMLHRDTKYSKLLSNSSDPKLNSITANMEKSPLLASLLSKEDSIQGKKNALKSGVVDIKSPSVSGSTEYLEALKAAGLPTDVPIIVDTGDGNYVTLTEDVFMDVLSSSESLQFQVTEETLDDSVSITEGVVMQDGSIVTEEGRELVAEPNSSKKLLSGHFKQYSKPEPPDLFTTLGGKSTISNEKSDITETVTETLKSSASDDPDAVVLVEVKGNQVVRYVVSSKEINALKALNEEKKWQKAGFDSTAPISNSSKKNSTKIAEINLTLNDSEAPKKSYITEFIETGSGLTSVAKAICERLPVKVYKENLSTKDSDPLMVNNAFVDKVDRSKLSTSHAYEALAMMCNDDVKEERHQKPRQSNIENIELMQNSEMEISSITNESQLINTNSDEYIFVSEESQMRDESHLHGMDPNFNQVHMMNGARNVVLLKNKNGAPLMYVEDTAEPLMSNRIIEMEGFGSLQKDSKSIALKQCLGEGEDEQFQYVLDSSSVDKEMLDDSNSNQSYSNMVLYSNKDTSLEDAGVKYQMVDDQFSDRMRENKMLSNILLNSTPEIEDELIMNEENDVKSLGMINQVLNTTDQLNENDVTESSGYHSASIEFHEENDNSAFGDENGVGSKEDNVKYLSKETVFSENSENDNFHLVDSREKSEDFCSAPKNSSIDVPFMPKSKSNESSISDRVLRKRRSSSSCDAKQNSMKNCVSVEKRNKLLNDNHNENVVIMGNGDENALEESQFFGNGLTDTMMNSQLIDGNNLS